MISLIFFIFFFFIVVVVVKNVLALIHCKDWDERSYIHLYLLHRRMGAYTPKMAKNIPQQVSMTIWQGSFFFSWLGYSFAKRSQIIEASCCSYGKFGLQCNKDSNDSTDVEVHATSIINLI